MADDQAARLHAVVEGRVQGVGFRAFVIDHAYTYNLTGWVRNTASGQVEVTAEGPRAQLEQLLLALPSGSAQCFCCISPARMAACYR